MPALSVVDRQSFFKQLSFQDSAKADKADKSRALSAIKEKAKFDLYAETNDTHVTRHLKSLEIEVENLYSVLKRDHRQREQYLFFCYYLCVFLELYYAESYGKKTQAEAYGAKAQALAHCYETGQYPEPKKTTLAQDIAGFFSTPVTSFRTTVNTTNTLRLQHAFARAIVRLSIMLSEGSVWFEQFGQGMLSRLDSLSYIFFYLSGALPGIRLLLNMAMLFKHTLFPSKHEGKLSLQERFWNELRARHWNIINDIVWSSVNTLTNLGPLFKLISSPVANWLAAGFLVFDVFFGLYRRHLAKMEYESKKSEYQGLLEDIRIKLNVDDFSLITREQLIAQQNLLLAQLEELERGWSVQNARLYFYISAAVVFAVGYGASFLITSAFAAPIGLFICSVAISMYLSEAAYGTYYEKGLLIEQKEKQLKGLDSLDQNEQEALTLELKQMKKELNQARLDLALSLTKNAVMPLVMMGALAISWEAAIIVAALFITFEVGKVVYSKYFKASPPALLPAPEEAPDPDPELTCLSGA